MVKVKEQVHEPVIEKVYPRCRECNGQIQVLAVDLTEPEIKIFHPACYTKFLKAFKESAERSSINIQAEIHGKKRSKKRLISADMTLSGDDTFE